MALTVATVMPITTNAANSMNKALKTGNSAVKLNRLLQLCSANLPVGGFSFSQGLEYAVDAGWITTAEQTKGWVSINLDYALAHTDLALLKRLFSAVQSQDEKGFERWNDMIIACRESDELLLADLAMGKALMRLLSQLAPLDIAPFNALFALQEISFVSSFALAAHLFELDLYSAQSGYCWTFIDNQIAAATKLVPLGQTQAQNLLFELSNDIEAPIAQANQLEDDEIGASLPHLAMASAWHETQYSRLFRS